MRMRVWREVPDGGWLALDGGAWEARDCRGEAHRFAWDDLVRFPAPAPLDANLPAPYGVTAALAEARGALAWVAAHTPDDCETAALHAEVTLRRNGGPPSTVRLDVRR